MVVHMKCLGFTVGFKVEGLGFKVEGLGLGANMQSELRLLGQLRLLVRSLLLPEPTARTENATLPRQIYATQSRRDFRALCLM